MEHQDWPIQNLTVIETRYFSYYIWYRVYIMYVPMYIHILSIQNMLCTFTNKSVHEDTSHAIAQLVHSHSPTAQQNLGQYQQQNDQTQQFE